MFRLDESDSTAETPVVGDGRREMSIELQTHGQKETPSCWSGAIVANSSSFAELFFRFVTFGDS